MYTVTIDDGKFVHSCHSLTAAQIIVDVARRVGRKAIIEGYLY